MLQIAGAFFGLAGFLMLFGTVVFGPRILLATGALFLFCVVLMAVLIGFMWMGEKAVTKLDKFLDRKHETVA
jgi:hypothetical protein